MTEQADPYEILGLEPTLDRAAIKRAYFVLLPRHAPHADPEGFRRLRDAYELLMGPGLVGAWSSARVDVAREREALDDVFGARIEQAKQERAIREARRSAIATFEGLLRLDLAEARRRATPSD